MSEFTSSLAVVIGINEYSNRVPRLQTAVPDSEAVARLLQERYGYEVWLRTNAQATKIGLSKLLREELPAALNSDSRLIFYFAGHGIAEEDADIEGPVGYLLPQDAGQELASFLSMEEVYKALAELPCRHFLAILDCCFAGAFRWASTRAWALPKASLHQERYNHYVSHPAWQVLTSTAFDQVAYERTAAGKALGKRGRYADHSPFAAQLLQGLSGAADLYPVGHGDGVITVSELYAFLQNLPVSQIPNLEPLPKHRQGEFVFRDASCHKTLPPAPPLDEAANPYRGLEPYERQHAHLFFGRHREQQALAKRVMDNPLTVVVGASGTGKSSLVRAGLIPFLEGSTSRSEDTEWEILPPLRPGPEPFHSLAASLRSASLPEWQNVDAEKMENDEACLSGAIASWIKNNGMARRLLITVDQVEELITLVREEKSRPRFLAALGRALDDHAETLRVVMTVRSDFEPQIAPGPLRERWQAARFTVSPLTQNELREVIERPASERTLFFEDTALVDELINEVVQMPGALPLLSFTLSEMYRQYLRGGRKDREMTRADYEAVGGVIGSLRKRANEEYESLPDDAHRATMRRIMLRMVSTEGGELARRRAPRSELTYADAEENQRVAKVLKRLEEARLLVSGDDDAS